MKVLSVAGEASGDGLAGQIMRELALRGVEAFGLGGPASEAAGVELVGRLEGFTSMGAIEPTTRLGGLVRAHRALVEVVGRHKPGVAVLVGFSEYCGRLGLRLRRQGVRVLWCMPPQVWAWRPWRTKSLARSADRMAVILPFEEVLWRGVGVDARYLGHPALDIGHEPSSFPPVSDHPGHQAHLGAREQVRQALGITQGTTAIALLPGSRPHEIRRHAPAMLAALERVRNQCNGVSGHVVLSRSLDPSSRAWLTTLAGSARVRIVQTDAFRGAAPVIRGFDAAVIASGTATLEAALAGVPSVVVYRMGAASFLIARLLVRVPHVALPNVLLRRRAFPELLQSAATPDGIATELIRLLAEPRPARHAAQELWQLLAYRSNWGIDGTTAAQRIAAWTMDWFS